jgi:hypothetical protein
LIKANGISKQKVKQYTQRSDSDDNFCVDIRFV